MPCLYTRVHNVPFRVKLRVRLGDYLSVFVLGAHINDRLIYLYPSIIYLQIGRFNESKAIDLSMNAKRGDQSDIRSLRCFDRTEASVVGVVYVAHLKRSEEHTSEPQSLMRISYPVF